MLTFDLSPMLRSTVGFDRMLGLLDQLSGVEEPSCPPYNIVKQGEDQYRIFMAVVGFSPEDLEIIQQENVLVVRGRKADDDGVEFLHRGIAGRSFERRFNLADFIKVTGASLDNGLLRVDLVREVPEAMKPRTIRIQGPQDEGRFTGKAA